jgi:integrase
MRGHVRKRGQKWAYVVDVGRDDDGRRIQKWGSGFERRKEAEAGLTEALENLRTGSYVEPAKLTVAQFLTDEWLPAMRGSLRPSTFDSYEMIVRTRIGPEIGTVALQRLTPSALNAMYGKLLEGGEDRKPLSARSVRYSHAVLRHALSDAVKWDRLVRNVADSAEPPSAKAAKPRKMPTWNKDQLRTFLDHVREDRLFAAWRVLATTGMRRGELMALRWADLDLDAGQVAIPDSKTGSGRSVALDKETVAALRAHRKAQAAERLALGPAYTDQGLVFCREDGAPIWAQSISRMFKRHAGEAGLPSIRLHDVRHTAATLALQTGIHPKVVSERLGHATIAITLDTYSHVTPGLQEDAAAAVAALLD